MTEESGTLNNPLLRQGTPAQLERFLLMGVFVAGKSASQMQPKLERFLACLWRQEGTPLERIRALSEQELFAALHECRCGQYNRIGRAFRELADARLDLSTCSREDLTAIHGISLKSASFFLVYTRDADYAVWDVHLLRWARGMPGFPDDIPPQTPSQRKYLALEQIFLEHCRSVNRRPWEVDWEIWSAYRRITKPNELNLPTP